MKLSKTDFLVYRDCAHNAWLKIHKPEVYGETPPSVFDQSIMETGNEVDKLARDLFPGGELVARGDAGNTAQLVAEHSPILYQPVFETDRYMTACDILVWNAAANVYDLYEVKSSTSGDNKKAKEELYTYDLAFQAEVLRENRVPLGQVFLMRLDGEYVRGDKLDVQSLFSRDDFSERVGRSRESVAEEMAKAYEVLQSERELPPPCSCLLKGRSAHCTTFAQTNPHVAEYSVHDITHIGMSQRKLGELIDHGILAIEDVPDDFEGSDAQTNQVRAAKTKHAMIDTAAIENFLSGVQYPIAFLDYETHPCAIPRFAGYRPYDHIPFQFSLDVIDGPDSEFVHHEFLFTQAGSPDAALLAALKAAMPASGSVVTWNKTFEKGINDSLGKRNPGAREFLANVNERVVDLMDVFSTQAYVHPDFMGKTSIKNIQPVLVPSLSYKHLAIQEGATATVRWNEVVTGEVDATTAAQLRTELLRYCGRDTQVMVEIWRGLPRMISHAR